MVAGIVVIIVCLAFLFVLAALAGVLSSNNRGNNWGRHHMHDLGLDDYKDDQDMKPF